MRPFVIVCGLASALCAGPALADDEAVGRGLTLAETWCQQCHVIGTGTQARALSDSPSFASLARRPGFDRGTVAFALLNPHPVMPTFPITQRDVNDLAAYIASLDDGASE